MNVIILAAGYGTRLERDILKSEEYKHLSGIPKPLIPLNKKPLIYYLINDLKQTINISDIFIITNDKFYDQFITNANLLGISTNNIYSDGSNDNSNRKGAICSLNIAIEHYKLQNSALLVLGGDTLFMEDFSFKWFIEQSKNLGNVNLVTCYNVSDEEVSKRGILEVVNKKIINFLEKPLPCATASRLACPCLYLFEPSAISKMLEYGKTATFAEVDAPGSFISYLSKVENVYTAEISGRFDIGGLETYISANEYFIKRDSN